MSTILPSIPQPHLIGYCKPGKKESTCRYLGANQSGHVCLKKVPDMRLIIEERFAAGTLNAKGDNCQGLDPK